MPGLINKNQASMSHLKQALLHNQDCRKALLEAIRIWDLPEETYEGKHYRYIINDEAFNLPLLAQRLCHAVKDMLPEVDSLDMFKTGMIPADFTKEEFKELLGDTKFFGYLNYFYGVVVERALIMSVEEEIEKEQRLFPSFQDKKDCYQRIYDNSKSTLLKEFSLQTGEKETDNHETSPEFTYWLFKYRMEHNQRAKVASDTKKGLDFLNRQSQQ
ncbi:MAG: hypothetical protein NTV30_07000 [Chloroflexi bacterium]|nr:hypothetical protein [Chloroflexota bacterium]